MALFTFSNMNKVNEVGNNILGGGDETESSEDVNNEEVIKVEESVDESNAFVINSVEPSELRKVNQSGFSYVSCDNYQKEEELKRRKEDEETARLIAIFNKSTIVDNLERQVDMKLINATFVIFAFFYVIVKTFGETTYILLITMVSLLIFLLLWERAISQKRGLIS